MTASTGIQVAVEKESDQLGLFTKHLVDGIKSGEADRNRDGLVDIHELYQHVHEKVREEGAQEPMKWGFQAKGTLIIAKNGRNAKEKWRQMLLELARQSYLSDSILGESLKLVASAGQDLTAKDKECLLLIEQLADGKISPADFVEKWVKTCLTDKQGVAKDAPSSKKNWLLYDVFADLLLRRIPWCSRMDGVETVGGEARDETDCFF